MGFHFVRTERLILTGSTRHCLAYPSSGITLAVGTDINVDVGPRRDKRNNTQVYVWASFGATRMWGEKVVQINCEE